jgi:hypothetical protein
MKLITVAIVGQAYEAHLLKMLLEEEGIPVFLGNEAIAQLYANLVGGSEIQVPDTDAEKARTWLIENGYESCLK